MRHEIRTALITGASRGLGRALVEALAARGVAVAAVARDAAGLADVVGSIRAAGGRGYPIVADLGQKDAIHRVSGQAAALLGEIDLLVHNASELGPTPLELLLDTECEDLERVLAVNLVGPFRLSKAVAGPMALRGTGRLVFVSSDAAVSAYPRWGAYGLSKAAADHLARTLAEELREQGLHVLAVDPGEMDTAMHRAALPEADRSSLARPEGVAATILEMLDAGEAIPSGARLLVSEWRSP